MLIVVPSISGHASFNLIVSVSCLPRILSIQGFLPGALKLGAHSVPTFNNARSRSIFLLANLLLWELLILFRPEIRWFDLRAAVEVIKHRSVKRGGFHLSSEQVINRLKNSYLFFGPQILFSFFRHLIQGDVFMAIFVPDFYYPEELTLWFDATWWDKIGIVSIFIS